MASATDNVAMQTRELFNTQRILSAGSLQTIQSVSINAANAAAAQLNASPVAMYGQMVRNLGGTFQGGQVPPTDPGAVGPLTLADSAHPETMPRVSVPSLTAASSHLITATLPDYIRRGFATRGNMQGARQNQNGPLMTEHNIALIKLAEALSVLIIARTRNYTREERSARLMASDSEHCCCL